MTEEECLQAIDRKLDLLLQILSPQGVLQSAQAVFTPDCPALYAWLDTYLSEKAAKIKPKSLAVLDSGVNRYIKPHISDMPLYAVRPADIQHVIDSVPHSFMRQTVYMIFAATFRRAYRLEYLPANPMDKIDFVKHYRKQGCALSLETQAAFIAAIAANPLRPLYLAYLLTGCRRSELLALRWDDIDTARNCIFIHGTKTKRAARYIPLFPQLADLLATLPRSDSRVFPYTSEKLRRNFDKVRAANGFTFRIHDLRHTFATRCLESGIAVNTVQKWLGHCSPSITANIYLHVLPEFERAEVERFNPRITP